MNKIDTDLSEIGGFIEKWIPECPNLNDKLLRPKIKSSYKQFHALLIWGMALHLAKPLSDDTKTYFKECLSDLSHAYMLNLCSFYKSSRSSLRSAVENGVRVLLLNKGTDISGIVSVYDMFVEARSLYKGDGIIVDIINRLYKVYGDLCKSVHSSHVDYLSLAVPFSELSTFDAKKFIEINENIREVSSCLNQCSFWIWDAHLPLVGHPNSDLVRDAVPRNVKRAKTA